MAKKWPSYPSAQNLCLSTHHTKLYPPNKWGILFSGSWLSSPTRVTTWIHHALPCDAWEAQQCRSSLVGWDRAYWSSSYEDKHGFIIPGDGYLVALPITKEIRSTMSQRGQTQFNMERSRENGGTSFGGTVQNIWWSFGWYKTNFPFTLLPHILLCQHRSRPTLIRHFLEDFTWVTSLLMCVLVIVGLNKTCWFLSSPGWYYIYKCSERWKYVKEVKQKQKAEGVACYGALLAFV